MEQRFIQRRLTNADAAIAIALAASLDDHNAAAAAAAAAATAAAAAAAAAAVPAATEGKCQVCLEPDVRFTRDLSCACACCAECLKEHLTKKIQDGTVICLCPVCSVELKEDTIKAVVDDEVFDRYTVLVEKRKQDIFVRDDPNLCWCPTPNCNSIASRDGPSHSTAKCDKCKLEFCFTCYAAPHKGQTCEQALKKRAKETGDQGELEFMKYAKKATRRCPKCEVLIERDRDNPAHDCNHMICGSCHTEFCWLCGRAVPPIGHFDVTNITGCPGLQYVGPDVKPGQRFGAKARALRLRTVDGAKTAARVGGLVVVGTIALPFFLLFGVSVGAYRAYNRARGRPARRGRG